MSNKKKPLVSISCITYNHEKYIEQCLDGFFMQKTNFDFEVLIHDDASTDKTQEIIKKYEKKYPGKIKAIYQKENQYSKGVRGVMSKYNFPRAQGKYIALCEGDDYWTDPYKLQKQVDFLENNPEYIICGTNVERIKENGQVDIDNTKKFGDISLDDILYRNRFTTCTTLFKANDLNSKLLKDITYFEVGDWPLWCSLLQYGKGYIMKDITAQYNIHSGGMVSGRNLKNSLKAKLHDRLLLIDNFPQKKNIIKKYGYRIILHYIKNSLKFKPKYFTSLKENTKLIFKFIVR